ncbi:MAG TPA: nuclear transport factor 2 family protein [Pyrinomonadaceae bacterium]|jgi:ketosteroid isomerase-like protein
MKRCPTCQRRYADETLNFCLEDGTSLLEVNPSTDETLTLEAGEPPPTEVLDPALMPTFGTRPAKPAAPTARQQARATLREEVQNFAPGAAAPPPARSTTSVVMLSVVATILLLALGGLGAWLLLRDTGGGTEVVRDGDSNVRPTPTSTPDLRGGNTSTPAASPRPTSATPTPTPQPTPTPTPRDTGGARGEVAGALEGWRRTMTSPDVNAHMAYYADTLHTYYNAKNVGVQMVRNNVARAFSAYETFDVRIDNLEIEVDSSGTSAVATFDKTFAFRGGGGKTYEGSGRSSFWFERVGGRWLITGEKDLKIYYVNK